VKLIHGFYSFRYLPSGVTRFSELNTPPEWQSLGEIADSGGHWRGAGTVEDDTQDVSGEIVTTPEPLSKRVAITLT
jgi:hypothetical protein